MKRPSRIKLSRKNKYCLVDKKDRSELAKYIWFQDSRGYAVRNSPRPDKKQVLMHRQILGLVPGDGIVSDHVNGNKLDNTRKNLRACTTGENVRNRKGTSSKYKYKGISFDSKVQRFRAHLEIGGKRIYSKRFKTLLEAARARDDLAIKFHGKFASLNFKKR